MFDIKTINQIKQMENKEKDKKKFNVVQGLM